MRGFGRDVVFINDDHVCASDLELSVGVWRLCISIYYINILPYKATPFLT